MDYFKDNKAKEAILRAITNILVRGNYIPEYKIDSHELLNECKINNTRFTKNINYLCAEGYILISEPLNGTCNIRITEKGIAAASSNYFENENKRTYFLIAKESIAVLINLIIAGAAVYALNKDSTNEKMEIASLKTRLDSIALHIQKEEYINRLELKGVFRVLDTVKVSLVNGLEPKTK